MATSRTDGETDADLYSVCNTQRPFQEEESGRDTIRSPTLSRSCGVTSTPRKGEELFQTRTKLAGPRSNGILRYPPLCPILCINPMSRIHSTLQKNSVEYQLNLWCRRINFTREIQEQVNNPNLRPNVKIILLHIYFMHILKVYKMNLGLATL